MTFSYSAPFRWVFVLFLICCAPVFAQQLTLEQDSVRKEFYNTKNTPVVRLKHLNSYIRSRNGEDFDEIQKMYRSARTTFGSESSKKVQFYLLYCKALLVQEAGETRKSIEYFEAAAKLQKHITSKEELLDFYNTMGISYEMADAPNQAIVTFKKCIQLEKDLNLQLKLGATYANIGNVYKSIENWELALKYGKYAIDIFKAEDNLLYIGYISMNVGYYYQKLNKPIKALEYYLDSEDILSNAQEPFGLSAAQEHIAVFYRDEGNYPKAWEYIDKCMNARRGLANKEALLSSLITAATIKNLLGETNEALIILEEADSISQITKSLGYSHDLAEAYYETYKNQGNSELALHYYESSVQLQDSLDLQNDQSETMRFDIQHQFELKAAKDSLKANQELQIKEEKQLAAENQRDLMFYGAILFGSLLMFFTVFAVRRYKLEARQKALIIQQRQMIEDDYHSLKEFTENAAHEMQTPMAIINSKLEALMQSPSLNPEERKHIGKIYTSTYRMSVLNRSLLVLSKIENHQFPLNEKIDLATIMEGVLEDFEEMIRHKGLTLISNISDGVVKTTNEFLATTIAYNLIKNSIAHNVPNGSIRVLLNDGNIVIENTGNNLNVSASSLFERFKKDSTHENSTGLGLAIVKTACDVQGWGICYDHDQGTHRLTIQFNQAS